MSNFLRREADSFFFRRRVPSSLRTRLGQTEIYRSLKSTVRRPARARAAHLFIATKKLFPMLEDDDDEFPFTDHYIRVAVRRWLDTSAWKQRLKIVDDMSPGGLRAYHESVPNTLNMSADDGISYGDNLSQEAKAALDHSEYFDVRSGDRLRRTAAALQDQLREYVDRRMQAVFGQETVAATSMQPVVAPAAPRKAAANMTKLSSYIKDWQKDIIAGHNHSKGLGDRTTDQYLKTVQMFIALIGDLPVGKVTFVVPPPKSADTISDLLSVRSNVPVMTSHIPKIGVLSGSKRRRRWSTTEKLAIVQETYEPDVMARIRGKDAKPEKVVRHLIHSLRYRYRLHRPGLPGKLDLVFPSRMAVIFVDG
jgi:hypothetical protein